MISRPNIDDASTATGSNARFSLLGLLMLSFGLLLSTSQRGLAAPGHHVPDHASAPGVSISVLKDNSVAGSGVADVVQITLNPAPNPGDLLEFDISTSSYTPQVTTDPTTGIAILTFSSSIVGPATVDIYDETTGEDLGTVTVHFIATVGPPDQTKSYFVVTQNPASADGSAQDIVKAYLFDANNNPVGGYNVAWSIESGVASFVSSPSETSITPPAFGGGTATMALTSTTVGTVDVQAFVSGPGASFQLTDKSNNNFLPIQFVTPPPDPTKSYIVAVTTPMPADGTSQDVVKAVVNNTAGNPVPDGTVVTFTIQTGTATITTTGVTSGGVAIADLTSLVVGSVRVQAQISVNGTPTYLTDQANPGNAFVTVQFSNPPPDPTKSYVVAVTTPMPADGTSQDVVKAVVNNTLGNPVPDGTVVTFTIKSGTATITTTGVTTGGVAIADLTSLVVGSVQVQAQITVSGVSTYLNDQANPTNNYVTVQFTNPPPDPTKSYVVAVTTPMPADGTSQDVVKAVVNNTLGNPVPDGTIVTFTIKSGTATITTTGVTSGGVAIADLTSLVVGSVQVQAQITVNGVATYLNDQATPANNYVTVQFTTPPPDPTKSYIVAVTTPMPADGTSQDVVKAVVNNTAGNPVPDGTVVTFTVETGTATITTTGVTTGGVAIADLTSLVVGSVQVQAQITVSGVSTYLNDQVTPANNYVTVQFTNPPPDPTKSYVVAVTTPMPADGTSQDVVKAVVNNTLGNPVPDGTVVTFTIKSGTATITTTGVTTGGVAIADLTSLVVGSVQVQAQITVNGVATYLNDQANPTNNYVTVQFTTPPPDPTKSYIVAITTPMPADGTSQDVVKAVVNNTGGNPVPDGTVVTFTIKSGTATITTTGVTTGGVAIADLTSLTVGFVQVQAQITVGGVATYLNDQANPANNYVTVQFIPPPLDAAKSYIVAVTTPMPADGTSQDVVKAVVDNTAGNPAPDGTVVTFTIKSGTATITTTGVTTGGVAIADLTSLVVGSVQVQAQITVNGVATYLNDQANPTNNYVTVQFTNPPPDPTKSYVVAVTTPMPADGISQDVVKAVVNNTLGNPVPDGTVVTFTIKSGTATITTTGVTTGGVAIADLTSSVVGSVQVQAQITVNGVATYLNDQATPANNYVTVQFTTVQPDPTKSYIVAVTTPMPADGTSQDVVKAVVNNTAGNPVPDGTVVTFTIKSGTATITTTGVTTGGVAIADLTSLVVGPVQVQGQITVSGVPTYLNDQATPANNYVTVQFNPPPPDVSKSYIAVVVSPQLANGTSQDVVKAVVNNTLGNPVPDGTIVTFTVKTGAGTISTTGVTTGGVAIADLTSTTVGFVQVQAQVSINGVPTYLNDQANPTNDYVTVQFIDLPADPTKSYIVAVTTPMPADGTSQDVVKAVVNNTAGNPVADGTVVTFTVETGTATITTTGVTSGGVAIADLTSLVVGSVQVQAQIQVAGVNYYLDDQVTPANNYVTVQFTAGPPDPAKSYIVVTQDNAVADGTSQDIVTAYLFDAQGRPVITSTNINFTIESGTATNVSGATQTITSSGQSVYASTTVGAVQVQAQIQVNGVWSYINDQNAPANNYVTIHFVVGPAVPGQTGGGGSGWTNPGNGGQAPGSGGSGSKGGAGGDGDNTGPGDNSNVTVLFVREPYDYQLANGVAQDSIIAYISDKGGHAIAGVAVTFFLQTSPTTGSATSTAQIVGNPVTVTTDDSGMARIAITNTMPGTVFVDATIVDPATGNTVLIDGSYQIAHFVSKPDVTNIQTALTVVVGEAMADGTQQNMVKAHVVDLDGNVMPDQEVYFAIDSGTGTIVTPQPVTTDANGDAFIQITSKTVGYVLITATVDSEKIVFGSPARVYFAMINIYVPRAFSPNNDGTNDLLKPILVGISTFHYFNVYNRWGNLIFTTQDPNQGWDGTFKGVPQPVETYLWIAEGIDENGHKVVQKGMTSLVR